MNKKLLYLLILFSINPSIAYAYLDPGTGSIILQALVSIIAAIAAFFSLARYKVKVFFKSLFKKNNNDANKDNK
jgi:hypothetical protein